MPDIRLPRPDQRVAVLGRTGGGKTAGALWLLSRSDFDSRPWVVVDFKRESWLRGSDLSRVPWTAELSVTARPPGKPGLYRMRPKPADAERVDEFFMRCWERKNIGLYVDEGLMLDKFGDGFRACLTQGRSLGIPMIVICQRPVQTSVFVFTQADYFMIFRLIGGRDYDILRGYVGDNVRQEVESLPPYHSVWYDVGRDTKYRLKPVPRIGMLRGDMARRLPPSFWGDLPRRSSV